MNVRTLLDHAIPSYMELNERSSHWVKVCMTCTYILIRSFALNLARVDTGYRSYLPSISQQRSYTPKPSASQLMN